MTAARALPFFVDTNVFVYAYDPAYPDKQAMAQSLVAALRFRRAGVISTQVLGELFNALTRKVAVPLDPREAEATATRLSRSWPVVDIDRTTTLEAIRGAVRYQFSYWDSLIWAAAKLNGASFLLSEDLNDGALIEGVRILNPLRPGFELPF